MPSLTLETVVAASREQVAATLGDEVVILGLEEGNYFGLRGVAVRIWELVQRPTRLRAVADVIVAEFEVERPRCEADVLAFAESLARRHLIEVAPEA